jgi:CBS domain-containing protein
MALGIPEVLGTGYGWVQQGLVRHALLGMPLWIVIVLPFARILATGFSIGSGGSGGIFGPGIVIGAFLGAALWRVLEPVAPAIPHGPAPFVIIGMMACFGSISRAPLAVMLMVIEMTASLEALAPAMLAVGIATLIVHRSDATIYRSQKRTRNDSPAHRLQRSITILGNVRSAEVMAKPRLVLEVGTPVTEALSFMERAGVPGAPVANRDDLFVGTLTRRRLGELQPGDSRTVDGVLDPTAVTVQESVSLDVALEALSTTPDSWVTVLDSGQHPVGIVTTTDIVRGYRRAVGAALARLSGVSGGAVQVEARVHKSAEAVGSSLRRAGLPPGTVIISIERGGGLFFPDGDTVFEPGDLVTATAPEDTAAALRSLLCAPSDERGHAMTGSPLT